MRTFRSRFAAATFAALAAVGATATRAGADPPHFDTPPTIGAFSNVTLNGTDQLAVATMTPFVVIDDSGALAGWHVSLLVPDFQNGTGPDCSTGATATLSASSLSMNPPVVAAGDVSTSMTGVTASGYTDFTTDRTIVDAAAGYGDGTYAVSPQPLKLPVPGNTRAGDYCTLATITITSGP